MNCKQGDLAVFVRSTAGNEGKIVTCVEFLGPRRLKWPDNVVRKSPCWKIDRLLIGCKGDLTDIVADEFLRPIRGGEGMDEMIRITGKPKERHNA